MIEQMAIGGWQIRFLAAHLHRAYLRDHRSKLYQAGDIVNLPSRWLEWARIQDRTHADDAIDGTFVQQATAALSPTGQVPCTLAPQLMCGTLLPHWM
jgi:hypothetical protein